MGSDPITDQIPDPPSIETQAGRGVPSDNTTLVEVLERYDASGYSGQFGVTDEIEVRCFACRRSMRPEDVELVSLRRMEGASDPDDMLAVAALECPNCGTRGTAVITYGPEMGPDDAEVLRHLEAQRS